MRAQEQGLKAEDRQAVFAHHQVGPGLVGLTKVADAPGTQEARSEERRKRERADAGVAGQGLTKHQRGEVLHNTIGLIAAPNPRAVLCAPMHAPPKAP